jgi:3-oxoacyl-[acyl-carrier protein] reductase
MDLGIAGQVAVVTGAGRGIGAATAKLFAEEGARVVVWDRDEAPAREIAGAIEAAGGEALALTGSVASPQDVDAVTKSVMDRFGAIHILVNNAGFANIGPITMVTDEQWSNVVDVHMKGAFNCVRAMSPTMIAQNYGRIINISSLSILGAENMAPYAAAKAGLVGFTRALAVDLGRYAITVNAIAPGYIRTDRVKASPTFPRLDPLSRRAQTLDREGSPEDVANAVLFFASKRSGFVTGDLMYVTGGMYQLW